MSSNLIYKRKLLSLIYFKYHSWLKTCSTEAAALRGDNAISQRSSLLWEGRFSGLFTDPFSNHGPKVFAFHRSTTLYQRKRKRTLKPYIGASRQHRSKAKEGIKWKGKDRISMLFILPYQRHGLVYARK